MLGIAGACIVGIAVTAVSVAFARRQTAAADDQLPAIQTNPEDVPSLTA
jgi:hypothetical protein